MCDLYLSMGWLHLAAEAAGALHGKMCDALGDVVDSPLRACARSAVAMVLYAWGCREDPLQWNFEHTLGHLGKMRQGARCPVEIWLLVRGTGVLREGRSCTLQAMYAEGHAPAEGEVLSSAHDVWTGLRGFALWEGASMSTRVRDALGREREVSWVMVYCGIVVLPHL